MTVDPASTAANATTIRPARTFRGEVVAFDGDVGLGALMDSDGREYRFHAAEIADGTRSIEVGADVWFEHLVRFAETQAGRIQRASR